MAGSAQAASVTFSNIVDGNGSPALFDVSTTMPDAGNPNKLNIGLNNFMADGSSIATSSAVDTLSMIITAPLGYVITSVDYTEAGNVRTTDGVATASGSLVADNIPTNFLTQLFSPNAASAWTITPATTPIADKTSIAVSITNSLFAFGFTPEGVAQIEKTGAMLTVGIVQVPEPATALLLMMGMLGLAARRR